MELEKFVYITTIDQNMSAKYYLRKNICSDCKRYTEIPIGISSTGWRFLFYKDDHHKTVDDWTKEFVEPSKIFDEYGNEISFTDFIDFIRSKRQSQSLSKEPEVTTDGEYDYQDVYWS